MSKGYSGAEGCYVCGRQSRTWYALLTYPGYGQACSRECVERFKAGEVSQVRSEREVQRRRSAVG